MTNFILECRNLCCSYSGREVLKDISMNVGKGEFIGLVGPNGAGKTTLFRALSGYLKPVSGTVLLNGREISAAGHRERCGTMGVVPQNVFTPMPFRAREIVETGRFSKYSRFKLPTKEDVSAVEKAMKNADVTLLSSRYYNELSGGERQRVMLATALAQEPGMMLLDEPTSQLDMGHASSIMKLLEKLNRETKIAVVVISHDIQMICRYCSRLVFLKEGKITADGPVEDVLNSQNIERLMGCKVSIVSNSQKGYWICPG